MNFKNFFYYLLFLLLLSNPVYAYLDPGTGSVILNLIIGAIAGLLSFVSFYWQKTKTFLKKIFTKETKNKK